ncbi:unnamed protein product [Lathyrus oleraceus]
MDKWMTIPDMRYPIACRYNVIVVFQSKRLNITFPHCHNSTYVNNNHWVQLKLKPDFPLPPVTNRWRQNCTEDAKV